MHSLYTAVITDVKNEKKQLCSKFTYKNEKKKNLVIIFFDVLVTLKMGQGHQNWYACVELNGDYYHAEFYNLKKTLTFRLFAKSACTSIILFK